MKLGRLKRLSRAGATRWLRIPLAAAEAKREAERYAPGLRVHKHRGADGTRGAASPKWAKTAALVVTGYALLHRDRELFERVVWRGMVLDEAPM